MAEFIVNPRRSPRAPARCHVAVVSTTQGAFEAETEDIGTMGCQLVSPKQVRKGDLVNLVVTNERLAEPLKVSGRVAWVSPRAPFRVGIAFVEGAHAEAGHWFDRLLSAYPGLGGYRRVPDKIRADQTVYLGAPPKFLLDFTPDEAMLLRAIASGARVDELKARLRDRWPVALRALFSLIARQAVTFQRGQAVHPDSWKKILSDVEASLALDEIGKAAPAVYAPPPAFEPAQSRVAGRRSPADAARPARAGPAPGAPPSTGAEAAWASGRPLDPTPPLDLGSDAGPPLEVAAPGWNRSPTRSGPAQEAYDRALAEMRTGSVNHAIALLRRALQLAPGDPEIADTLGKLAFRGR